jgi:hypothetical protein
MVQQKIQHKPIKSSKYLRNHKTFTSDRDVASLYQHKTVLGFRGIYKKKVPKARAIKTMVEIRPQALAQNHSDEFLSMSSHKSGDSNKHIDLDHESVRSRSFGRSSVIDNNTFQNSHLDRKHEEGLQSKRSKQNVSSFFVQSPIKYNDKKKIPQIVIENECNTSHNGLKMKMSGLNPQKTLQPKPDNDIIEEINSTSSSKTENLFGHLSINDEEEEKEAEAQLKLSNIGFVIHSEEKV